ncbi:MAG: DNA photolyase [Candidatus Hydrogenedentota bacterium]|nr:MAG: DNA photolyase [Candidatus Hydrogenedentota bacterium]
MGSRIIAPAARQQLPTFSKVVIENSAVGSLIAENVIQSLPEAEIEIIENAQEFLKGVGKGHAHEKKDILLIYPHKGSFIHACPGSDGMLCCNYFIINTGVNCSYDCEYCYLQSYLNTSVITLFSNTDEMMNQILKKVNSKPKYHWRIGTGEYTDSLALEHLTGLGKFLITEFAKIPNATLELKTKSNNVDSLLNLNHNGHTVISWTMSPSFIAETVERKTASIDLRLEAAKAVQQAGYSVAIHFDPIIYYTEWEKDYKNLVDRIFTELNPKQIRWISLGTFRHSAGFKKILRDRFPDEFLTRAEMFPSDDGKMRYFAPLRAEMYRKMKSWIDKADASQFTYLCMETKQIWQEVYGKIPLHSSELDSGFEQRRLELENHYVS